MKLECTCKCIKNLDVYPDINNNMKSRELRFHKGREYQVDIYPLYFQVYQNGGWNDYIFQSKEEFNIYFKLIE